MSHDPTSPLNRDDALSARVHASRRRWLQHVLVLATVSFSSASALRALADMSSVPPLDAFLALSAVLTGKSNLNHIVAERLLTALQQKSPGLSERLPQLARALASGTLNEAQRLEALRILEGWYLGVVDNVVVTYEGALMFSAVSDVLGIRSYCPNQQGFWAAKPIERLA